MPFYNSASYLEACVYSIKRQHFKDWELLLVDDGSTDGSSTMADELAQKDARITVFHQENMGQFFARRVGIDSACGDYILFLDSDDEFAPNSLARIDAALREEGPDILLYTATVIRNGKETGKAIGRLFPEKCSLSPEWLKKSLISSNELNSLCLKAFRRELFSGDCTDYTALKGLHYGEDKAQLLFPVSRATSLFYIPECLYRYNYRAESTMHACEIPAIGRMISNEMFSLLRKYMDIWQMNDAPFQEIYNAYYIRNCLQVYFNIKKTCRSRADRREFRNYPWEEVVNKDAFRSGASHLLTTREKIKLIAAIIRL